MVSEFFIGLKVGATLSGVFDNAFRSARSALDELRKCSLRLNDAQKDLAGNVERTRQAYAGLDLARLESQHRQLESTLGRLTRQHEAWQASLRRGQTLQSVLSLQQTRRIELLASVRLSAVIRLVEEKVERQRRDQDKTQRDMPSADWQRPVQRGGKGGERKGGDSDAAGDAPRSASSPSSPASSSLDKNRLPTRQASIRASESAKPGEAVAELKRQKSEAGGWLDKAIDATEKLKQVSEISEKLTGGAAKALRTDMGRKVYEAARAKLNPVLGNRLPDTERVLSLLDKAEDYSGKAADYLGRTGEALKAYRDTQGCTAKRLLAAGVAFLKDDEADAAAGDKKADAKAEGKASGKRDSAQTKKKSSAKPGGKSRPGEAVAELKRQESESDGWLDKAIDATEQLKKVSEISEKLTGGAAKALRTDMGRKVYEAARAKLNPVLGKRLPDTERVLTLLDKAEDYSGKAANYLGRTGEALKAYRDTQGSTAKRLLAAGVAFLKDDEADAATGDKKADKQKRSPAAGKAKRGAAVAEAKRKAALASVQAKPGKALGASKKQTNPSARRDTPSKAAAPSKKKTSPSARRQQAGHATAQVGKPASRTKPGTAFAPAREKSAATASLLDKAIHATGTLTRGSELSEKLTGGAAKVLRTETGRKRYEQARAKLNPLLGNRLPDTDHALAWLDKAEDYSSTSAEYLGRTGSALKRFRQTKGSLPKRLLAAGVSFLKNDLEDEDAGKPGKPSGRKTSGGKTPAASKPAERGGKAVAKSTAKTAAKPLVQRGAALKEARVTGGLGKSKTLLSEGKLLKSGDGALKTMGGARGLAKGALKRMGALGDIASLGADLAEIRQSRLSPQAKSAAYGKALGGAAGSVAGGAAGAAIGSVLGPVGAFIGQQAGSWLGQKGGEWLGEKAGALFAKHALSTKPVAVPKPVARPQSIVPAKPASLKPAAALKPVARKPAAPAKPMPVRDRARAQDRQAQQLQRIQQAVANTSKPAKPAPAAAIFHITFSPQITISGGAQGVKQQVQQAMQLSFAEFERLMRRYESDRQRRSYAARG
ncbi:hypothetical protein C2134_04935 [Chromobacterium sinusclupearum]|uniref:Phage tail tape measure protein domain-containing protein n=1 Tax=Chromobacterium sinusclupearum TaxID=2077146 RepID=A0A2K4MRW5_9NEIS|nr:hypothetical protein [Chromobacterium sinusclupearum]POA99719.1 hypothetical protein C2134_04935 [Chromobacterium sinusclupearum]